MELALFGLMAYGGFLLVWEALKSARGGTLRHHSLATALGGVVRPDERIQVACEGVAVVVSFTRAGTSEHPTRWTYIEAALPAAYPLALFLRAHAYTDALEIQRGALVDVVMGDPAFDAAFLVEGAPADVVRHLFTPEVRASLMRELPVKVDVVNGVLQVLMSGWIEDVPRLQSWIAVVASLAGGVRDAFGAADAAIPPATSGGGVYREIPDDRPLQDARAARFAEVQRLGQLQGARTSSAAWILGGLLIFSLAAVLMVTQS